MNGDFMERYVYIDLLILINFCMNFIIIRLTGKLFNRMAKVYRAVFGSLFAAGAYALFFLFGFRDVAGVIFGAAGFIGGIIIAFYPVNIRTFGALILGAFALTAALGGGAMAAYYMLISPQSPEVFPLWALVLFTAAAVFAVRQAVILIRRKAMTKAEHTKVCLKVSGRSAAFTALVDTGHSLREPISGKPVIIAEFAVLKTLLPDEIKRLFNEKGERDLEKAASAFAEVGFANRLRLLPYSTIGERGGLLVGFRPDEALVDTDRPREVIIGVFNGKLSPEGEYQALIAPEIL